MNISDCSIDLFFLIPGTSLAHIFVKMKDLNTLSRWCAKLGLEMSLKLLTNLRSRFLGGGSIQKLSFPLQKAIKKDVKGEQ